MPCHAGRDEQHGEAADCGLEPSCYVEHGGSSYNVERKKEQQVGSSCQLFPIIYLNFLFHYAPSTTTGLADDTGRW